MARSALAENALNAAGQTVLFDRYKAEGVVFGYSRTLRSIHFA